MFNIASFKRHRSSDKLLQATTCHREPNTHIDTNTLAPFHYFLFSSADNPEVKMVRVANVVLRQRGGATTKETESAPVKGADSNATAVPPPNPAEPETTVETAAEDTAEASNDISAEEVVEEAAPTESETTEARTKRAARRSSADKTGKKEARKAERVEKKEVRQEKRDTKNVAKKEARKEANDTKKEARAVAAAEKKEKAAAAAAAAAENPESAGYFDRLLSWGRGASPKKEGEEKAEDAQSSDDEEETQVEVPADPQVQEPSVEPADGLYVVNDIPIRMTVAQPQPIAAC